MHRHPKMSWTNGGPFHINNLLGMVPSNDSDISVCILYTHMHSMGRVVNVTPNVRHCGACGHT